MRKEVHVPIHSDSDIVQARERGREIAREAGFSGSDQTIIASVISEVGRNMMEYAKKGEIVISADDRGTRAGIDVVARDEGPGIPNIADVLQDSPDQGSVAGLGLPGVRRLMDKFEILSEAGRGTTITMKKWAK